MKSFWTTDEDGKRVQVNVHPGKRINTSDSEGRSSLAGLPELRTASGEPVTLSGDQLSTLDGRKLTPEDPNWKLGDYVGR